MLKRRDAPYLPGSPKGQWWKWKARPAHHRCRADVCAARPRQALRRIIRIIHSGCGPRAKWRAAGAGRQGLFRLHRRGAIADRSLRPPRTIEKFGPVREVVHEPDQGLVLEVAFEGPATLAAAQIRRGDAVPRINRLRWDKPPREADRLETLGADAETRRNRGRQRFQAKACPALDAGWTPVRVKKTKKPRSPAIDANRRVPHLPSAVLQSVDKSAREIIDAQRHLAIAGSP